MELDEVRDEELRERLVALGVVFRNTSDPAENWCVGMTKDGQRCLRDTSRGDLCTMHWRMQARGDKIVRWRGRAAR